MHSKKRIIINCSDCTYLLAPEQIIYLESKGSSTSFLLNNDLKFTSSYPIKNYQDVLSGDGFLRCHRSFLVNLAHVYKIEKEGFIILANKSTIPIAQQRISAFIEKAHQYFEKRDAMSDEETNKVV
ncbi:MAG: LytTR family DNA-binding domain-containing protein [Bacteroidota bacterium]